MCILVYCMYVLYTVYCIVVLFVWYTVYCIVVVDVSDLALTYFSYYVNIVDLLCNCV